MIKKLAAAGLVSLMMFNTSALAITAADEVTSTGISTNYIDPNNPIVSMDGTTSKIGKIQWSQFNIPDAQTVDFGFTDACQTIINYVAPTVEAKNVSLIAGKLNTFSTNGICGRVFLINPNGVSFIGAEINADLTLAGGDYVYDKGLPSFFVSTLDLATPFASINDNTPNIQFETITDCRGFANGIYSDYDSTFGVGGCTWEDEGVWYPEGSLKELTFLGNGVAIANTDIDVTFGGKYVGYTPCKEFDSYFNVITAGEATVGLSPVSAQFTPIMVTASNLVPACSLDPVTGEFTAGGVRYFDFDPITFEANPNFGSEYQLSLCNNEEDNEIEVGVKGGYCYRDTELGITRIENRSDYFNTTGLISTAKVQSKITSDGAYNFLDPTCVPVIYLISKNPGQTTAANDPALFYICPQAHDDTSLFVTDCCWGGGSQEVATTALVGAVDSQVGLETPAPNCATRRTQVDTVVLPTDPRQVLNKPDCEFCFGSCGTPPDPSPCPPPPPPPPGDGGTSGAAIAIPLGIAGAGLLSLAALPGPIGAAAPVCQMMSTMRAIPTYAMSAPRYFAGRFAPAQTGAAAPMAAPSTGLSPSGSPYTVTPIQPLQPGYASPAADIPEDEENKK